MGKHHPLRVNECADFPLEQDNHLGSGVVCGANGSVLGKCQLVGSGVEVISIGGKKQNGARSGYGDAWSKVNCHALVKKQCLPGLPVERVFPSWQKRLERGNTSTEIDSSGFPFGWNL